MTKRVMWLAVAVVVGLSFARPAGAVVPDLIPLQGVLANAAGEPLDGTYNMVLAIYSTETGGTAAWTETRTGADAVAVDAGRVSIYLGEVEPLDFGALIGLDELWLGVTVSPDTEMNRIRLASVPYSQEAEYCAQLGDMLPEDLQEKLAFDCGAGNFVQGYDGDAGVPICGADQNTVLTETDVDDMVSDNGYATETWVNAQGFATQAWVGSQGFATQTWVNAQGYAPMANLNDGNTATAPVGWGDIVGKPSDLTDGDDDTLADLGLTCTEGYYVQFSGGVFACAGLTVVETDPEVGANTTNYVPKWNGTALVASSIEDNGTTVAVHDGRNISVDSSSAAGSTAALFQGPTDGRAASFVGDVAISSGNHGNGNVPYGCAWEVTASASGTQYGYAACGAGTYPVSGACYCSNSQVMASRPKDSSDTSLADGASIRAGNRWGCYCSSGTSNSVTASALCCYY
jgi:hypothetical protein